MDDAQLAMTQLLHDADERARAIRDHYRGRVHEWFEGLTLEQKQKLGAFMSEAEWDTCASLSVCACDFYRSQLHHMAGDANGTRQRDLARCAK